MTCGAQAHTAVMENCGFTKPEMSNTKRTRCVHARPPQKIEPKRRSGVANDAVNKNPSEIHVTRSNVPVNPEAQVNCRDKHSSPKASIILRLLTSDTEKLVLLKTGIERSET